MGSPRRFNWAGMGVSPAQVLEMAPAFRLGLGAALPEGLDWAMTPQGARFWYFAFLRGDKRAEAALGRMLRQAEGDLRPLKHFPPPYRIEDIVPSPAHLLRIAGELRRYSGPLPPGPVWSATPQGADFWAEYFSLPVSGRDAAILDGLLSAAERKERME